MQQISNFRTQGGQRFTRFHQHAKFVTLCLADLLFLVAAQQLLPPGFEVRRKLQITGSFHPVAGRDDLVH